MQILPVKTPVLHPGDSIADHILSQTALQNDDIIAISSKAVATAAGEQYRLAEVEITKAAEDIALMLGSAEPNLAFLQLVINETERCSGRILPSCRHALLTDLKPDGLEEGSILIANAGIDMSNTEPGHAVGWPKDCMDATKKIRSELQEKSGKDMAVMITDSCCRPRRRGVTAIALTVSGFDPLMNQVGAHDLHGKELRLTQEAIADQLATAANALMGNADQSMPAAIIREHNAVLSDFEGWVPGVPVEDDLFVL